MLGSSQVTWGDSIRNVMNDPRLAPPQWVTPDLPQSLFNQVKVKPHLFTTTTPFCSNSNMTSTSAAVHPCARLWPRCFSACTTSSSVTKDVPLGSQPDPSAVVIKQLLDRKWTNVTYLQSVFTHTQIACSLSFTHVQSANTPNCGWVVLKLHTWLQEEKAVEDTRLGQPCAHDILQCLPLRCPGVKSSL